MNVVDIGENLIENFIEKPNLKISKHKWIPQSNLKDRKREKNIEQNKNTNNFPHF